MTTVDMGVEDRLLAMMRGSRKVVYYSFGRQQIELLGGLLELVPLMNVDHGDGCGCMVVE